MSVDQDSGKFFTSFLFGLLGALWVGAAVFHFLPDGMGKWWGIPMALTVVLLCCWLFLLGFALIAALLFWIERKLEDEK